MATRAISNNLASHFYPTRGPAASETERRSTAARPESRGSAARSTQSTQSTKSTKSGLPPRAFGESGDARFRGTLDFREVKTDPRRIDLQALGLKVAAFFRKNPDLRRERFGVGGLSLKNM